MAAAAVVLIAFLAMAAVVLGVLHRQLLTDVDAAADRRVRDVVAGLQFDPPAELDTGLLETDSQIAVVQVIDSSGALVRASAGAPRDPLTDPALFGEVRTTVSTESEDGTDLRVSGAPADRQGTRYTVLVGADGTGVDSTVTIVAVLLAIAMPIVVTGAAAATFVLVRRSLRSVEAIRLRVAEISVANHTLAQRILDEAGTAIERLTEIEREFRRVVAAVARTERISAGSSGSFEDIANAATRANRLIINTAIGGAKADRATLDRELSAVAHAVQDVAQRSDLAAREQTVLHRTLAEAHGDADAMIAVRADLGRVLEALGTLREGLEVVEGGTAGVTTSVADTLAALCVDARFIDRELAALQGERELEDIASLALPPHPLDWDQLDEQVRMGVQAIDETGNMDPR